MNPSDWISVESRKKPKNGQTVLVYRSLLSPKSLSAIYWKKSLTGKKGFFSCGEKLATVTHWMPWSGPEEPK